MGMYKRNAQVIEETGTAVADANDVAVILSEMDRRLDRLFTFVQAAVQAEKVEHAAGWVLGRRSDGQRCVWLYPARDSGLEFKLTTVWVEQFGELPFPVPEDLPTWPSSSPPSKREAYQSGQLHACAIDLVFKMSGEFNDGKPVFKFDRILRDEEEEAVSVPRPRETPTVPSADEARVLRTAAVTSSGAGDAATAVYQLVPGAFKSPASAEKFLLTVVGNMPWNGGAALVAAQAYAAVMVTEGNWKVGLDAATAVYHNTAGVMG